MVGVPVASIVVAAVVGSVAFGPYKNWTALVDVVTGATAIMYAFAPVALAALHKVDGKRSRSYRVPMPTLVLPAAFCCSNLIIYWGGFETTWKLAVAMVVGLVLFAIGARRARTDAASTLRNAIWVGVWLAGQVAIGAMGRYGAAPATSGLDRHPESSNVLTPDLYGRRVSRRLGAPLPLPDVLGLLRRSITD
jgi:amino acid transporter